MMNLNTIFRKTMRCLLALALCLTLPLGAGAFEGSNLTSGQKYYLFNIYQSKFLGADNKLQAPNIGTPVAFTATATGFTIGGTTYTATKNAAGYYQLKNGSRFFAFEDKQNDPNSPDDENRRMYLGGGVLCQNTTNDTDRSYWQLISETEYAQWQAKKKFTVASLNVDGMPKSISLNLLVYQKDFELNPDATEGPGATEIGNRLRESGFDVVGVSEDFNYHGELWDAGWNNGQGVHYNSTTHVQALSQSTANLTNYMSSKPLFTTDGQCLFYRDGQVDRDQLMNTETRVAWDTHNGYTDQGADGLITKGFRYYIVQLADGTQLDLYSMHMDADDGQADRDARASQLTQLATYIKSHKNGRPIIIIGDSNCRYTRDKVKSNLIDAINEDADLTIRDPWIEFGRGGKYPIYPSAAIMASTNGYREGEVVDKIWYVNNKQSNIRLVAETYHQDLSFVASQDVEGTNLKQGSPLCDHKPCVVTFSYHDYDPAIDDQPVNEGAEEVVYLRNRETGRFLKSGGAWGTHAIVGNYPIAFTMIESNGKYTLSDGAGSLFVESNSNQPYVDGGSPTSWKKEAVDGGFVLLLTDNNQALTANDPYFFNDNPNYRWIITEPKNASSKLQQWEIVTEEQMMAEMSRATALSPYNATWLLSNPNFDRNFSTAAWANNISSDATRMTSNLGGNGRNVGDASDNMVAEAFVSKCSKTHWGSCNHGQTWDINQTITGIPNGYYRVTCQAFQRISNSNTTTATIELYGNDVAQQIELMYNLKEVTEAGMGTKKDGNYYYPDNMPEAALYFNAGYYQNAITVQVTDGQLKVGIRKTSGTGKDNTAWTCFDNFQLHYLGTQQPDSDYDMAALDERRTAAYNDDETTLTLTGLWRVEKESEIAAKLSGKSPLIIDATNATLIGKPSIPMPASQPNALLKVSDAATVANAVNVVADGKCANLLLTDKQSFQPDADFTALSATYTRMATAYTYGTICLPFDIESTPDVKLYAFDHMQDDYLTFTEVTEVPAGTPALYEKVGGTEPSFTVQNAPIKADTQTRSGDFIGTFQNLDITTGYYIAHNAFYDAANSSGGSVAVAAFRGYFDIIAGVKTLRIAIADEETGLRDITPQLTPQTIYNIQGIRLRTPQRGINIINGKKVLK